VNELVQDVYLTFSLISVSNVLLCEILSGIDHKHNTSFVRKI
jgi:hypothetical protein